MHHQLIHPNVNGEIFVDWVKNRLAPALSKGDVVVMDNADGTSQTEIEEAIKEAGARLIYLPPYSPDFNKIEKQWANPKRIY